MADVLHDVDFTDVGPTALTEFPVRRHHPDRCPGASCRRQFGANFKATILEITQPSSNHASRSVVVLFPPLLTRRHVQFPILLIGILDPGFGVKLFFFVSPPMTAHRVGPFLRIGKTGAIELIAPNQFPPRLGPSFRVFGNI